MALPNKVEDAGFFSDLLPSKWTSAPVLFDMALLEGTSGVSSESAYAGDDWSGPEEKSVSMARWGVVKEELRNWTGGLPPGVEKRWVCPSGLRRAGNEGFVGDSSWLDGPIDTTYQLALTFGAHHLYTNASGLC